jgi:hypothetical protein
MKKLIIVLLVALAINSKVDAQAPQGFNFQGIALDSTGYVVTSKLVSLRFSISTDSLGNSVSYSETASTQTDKYGQFTTVIGSGIPIIGKFGSINWSLGNLYMKTEIDISNTGKYVMTGLSKLLAVPYALQANSASNINSDSLHNTRVGSNSLNKNTTGKMNTAIGDSSLYSTTTGYNNTALGSNALTNNTTGSNNTANGKNSLYKNTMGSWNTAIGVSTLYSNTTGVNNTANGNGALTWNTTGMNNTAVGEGSLVKNTTGSFNTSNGMQSLLNNTTGLFNTAIGFKSGGKLTTGSKNIFIGNDAGNNINFTTTSNKLVIQNDSSKTPLIYGEFDNKKLTINGDLEVTGALKGSFNKVFKNGTNSADTMFLADDVDFYESANGFHNPVVRLPLPSSNNSNLVKRLNTSLLLNCRSSWSFKVLQANTDLVDELTLREGEYAIFTYAYNRWILTGKTGGLTDISSDTLGNTRTGSHSLEKNTTGSNNTATGFNSLYSNTTGAKNTANGYHALSNNTTGADNVAFGKAAGRFLTDGSTANTSSDYSVYLGSDTKASAENAQNEIVIGYNAIGSGSNTIQLGNTAVTDVKTSGTLTAGDITYPKTHGSSGQVLSTTGSGTLTWVSSGESSPFSSDIIVNGITVGRGARSIYSNSVFGNSALASNTTGSNNTASGVNALNSNTTGSNNTATGLSALYLNTTGSNNTASGLMTLYLNTTGFNNTANGYQALSNNATGYDNTANGMNSLYSNTTGRYNVSIGSNSLNKNTTGFNNVANGFYALFANTTGSSNTAVGESALVNNTTGPRNTGIGGHALFSNTTGRDNTANGYRALQSNTTGSYNTGIGYRALMWNSTGWNNTGIGDSSLPDNTTGEYNTAIGYNSGNTLTTGSNNTFIGNGASASTASVSNEIAIGNSSIATLRAQVTSITALSDRRDKTDIISISEGLDFIKQLKPVSFTWNTRDKAKVGIKSAGFIAQDLLALQQQSKIGSNLDLVSQENPEKLEARYNNLLPVIVKAIQEQNVIIKEESAEKDKKIADLEARLKSLEAIVNKR